ncbi:MAG TPA: hypothetical protein PLG47_03180 [Candidatus Dojkabacteria bacterium]|nr:hypothetical protein [Candidatus Dojkabacteria bacterium]
MSRTKGCKKTGGRMKGTPNKVTGNIKVWLTEVIDNNRKQIIRDLKALEPKERLQMIEKFMQYTVPKMQSVQAEIDFDSLSEEQVDNIIKAITKEAEQ